MKNQLLVLLLALSSFSVARAQVRSMPEKLNAVCGIKFIPLSFDPHTVSVSSGLGEGSDALDEGSGTLILSRTSEKKFFYEMKAVSFFRDRAPSYRFEISLVLDSDNFRAASEKFGALIQGAVMSYRVIGPAGIAGEGTLRPSDALVTLGNEGELTLDSFRPEENAVFSTGRRRGIFLCEISSFLN